jgi:diacylglycerol kinase (ATP)
MSTDSSPLDDSLDARLAAFSDPNEWISRAGRRGGREKFQAGVRGMKHAFRGDSSFFAHAYRGLFIGLTAILLGIGPHQWCLILIAAGLVLVSELAHSAVDSLARALGDAEAPGLVVAREIATAGVLVSVIVFSIVAGVVFAARMVFVSVW